MKINKTSIVTGRIDLLQAMNISKGKSNDIYKGVQNRGMMKAVISQHGTLNKYIVKVVATVPDRVHSHLRTHHLINEFYTCSTSRPDLTTDSGEERLIEFYLPLKRAIEFMKLRLCSKSWIETREFAGLLRKSLIAIEPALELVLWPSCIDKGYCPELKESCGYTCSNDAKRARSNLLQNVTELGQLNCLINERV